MSFSTTLTNCLQFCKGALVYYVYYILWLCLRTVNNTFQRFNKNSDKALIGRIIWRRKLAVFINNDPSDFLCLSYDLVESDYVLKPNVSLYCVSRDEATFVETPENLNLYSSDENPFLYMAQFDKGTRVIRMSISTFCSIAKTIGDPRVPVVWITSTGRCGSTILSQVFEAIPGTLTLAEPEAPQSIALMWKFKQVGHSKLEMILRAVIRMLCKPHPGITMFCIKGTPAALPIMADVSRLFPDIKHIFSYRDCLGTVTSWLGLMTATPYTVALRASIDHEWFASVIPLGRNHFIKLLINVPSKFHHVSLKTNTAGLFTHFWANNVLIAGNAISHHKSIVPVKYECLLNDPMGTCSRLFENIGIDNRYLDIVVEVFKKDSQRGTILSRSRVGDDPRRMISQEDRLEMDAILSRYGLPKLHEDFCL